MVPNALLALIRLADNVPLDFITNHAPYIPLFLTPTSPKPHGYIHPTTIASLPWPPQFSLTPTSVTISAPEDPSTSSTDHINTALQAAVNATIQSNTFPSVQTHSEPFLILGTSHLGPDLIQLERFAAPLFGIATRGAHLTAYVRQDNEIKIWVAKRSAHLFSHPGKLDSTIAGGVKASDTPTSCILAEAEEEACLSPSTVQELARATGVLTLANRNAKSGLFHSEILYVYDMELPSDVIPKPGDEEVEEFALMGVDEVRRRMGAGEFKPNVCPVMIDFFVRHGVVSPESEGEGPYVGICSRLRRVLPVPLGMGDEE